MARIKLSMLVSLVCLSSQVFAENLYSAEEGDRIKQTCIDLGRKFAEYMNTGQHDKISSLFEENGEYIKAGGKLSGRESIDIAFNLINKERNRAHILSNEMAEIHSKSLVVVTSYMTGYLGAATPPEGFEAVPRPYSIIRNYDECVKTDDGTWLWQTREVIEVFTQPRPASGK